jgi:fused signal recognition particle receptor
MGLLSRLSFELRRKLTGRAKLNDDLLEEPLNEFFEKLIEQDVAFDVAEQLVSRLRESLLGKEVSRSEDLQRIISQAILDMIDDSLLNSAKRLAKINKKPYLIIFLGINGSGKTTSIAKTAKLLKDQGKSVVLAAGDTFRAASIEQLEEHARRLGVPTIKGSYGQDPASVIYDAVRYAERYGFDFVLADTSGRVPTNQNLMRELRKIVEVNSPDRAILVLDLTQGRDIYEQIDRYSSFIPVTDLLFTKYDVDPKLGVILSALLIYKKPVFFVSSGQGYNDIHWLDKKEFLDI